MEIFGLDAHSWKSFN